MKPTEIETVAVLGAGTMGHGIAELAAMAGHDVHLKDVSKELVDEGYERIEWSLEKLEESGALDTGDAAAAIERIETFSQLDPAVATADIVIEAVPEEMEVKKEVFANADDAAPEGAVFASNTSTLPITDLSEATNRRGQVCGMHYFNPPVRMELVEVISGDHTDERTLELIERLATDLGKTPTRVRKDSPGFVVNRVLVPMLNEAAWLVETETATVAEVDSAAKFELGLPMGCFELLDQIGIDVAVDVIRYMEQALGAGYEPCPLLLEKVSDEAYGQKSGTGFYNYEEGGKVEIPPGAGTDEIASRLVAVAVNEAAKLVVNDVSTPDDIDEAVTLGAGFPNGPTALAAERGFDRLHQTLQELIEETGESRYEPSPRLAHWARGEGPESVEPDGGMEFETIELEHPGNNVAHIVLNRPDELNSVTTTLLNELDKAIDLVEADGESRALLITGAGDAAFCGGADLQFMADALEPYEAVEFSRRGQAVFNRLVDLAVPVIAGVDGFALGGGMELAACADLCIASEGSEFGQPEIDLGIIPAWGGTQRLRHIVGERRAREILMTANRYDAEIMYDYGFVNEVVTDGEFDGRVIELATDLARGPPRAYEALKNAMFAGQNDLEAGLRAESDSFGLLWTTEDTAEGIDAFHDRRDPEFQGR